MISKENFESLRNKYGMGIASWTIWSDSTDGKPKSGIDDVSFFSKEDILKELNTNFMFVGLNAAKHKDRLVSKPWQAFHSTDLRKSQDYKLRYALKDTKFWGSYITDVIKDYRETKSEKVLKMIKEKPEVVKENICMLEEEIQLLDKENTVIIAIGSSTYNILTNELGQKYRIFKIRHYSSYVGLEAYRKIILQQLQPLLAE